MSHFRRLAHIALAISILLPLVLFLTRPKSAAAQGGDGTKRQFNAQTGKVSFIGPESGRTLSGSQSSWDILLHPPGRPSHGTRQTLCS